MPELPLPALSCHGASSHAHGAADPFEEPIEDAGAGVQDCLIHIRIQQRNGRKTLATVQGLSTDYDLKKIVKVCKQELACNGTVVEPLEYGEVISLQGDQRTLIKDFLKKVGLAKEEQLKSPFGFGAAPATTQQSLFGGTLTFGTPASSATFGGVFGAPVQATGGLFELKPGFGTQTTASTSGLSFSRVPSSSASLFAKPFSQPNALGGLNTATPSTGFGAVRAAHRDSDEIPRQLQQHSLTDVERQSASQLLGNQQLPGHTCTRVPGHPLPGQSVSGVMSTAMHQIPSQPNVMNPASIGQAPAKPTPPDALARYRMDRRPRGYCLIINNRDFHVVDSDETSKPMSPRNGTDKDAELIEKTFKAMKFNVVRFDNLSDKEMIDFLMKNAYKVDHTDYDCFTCFILTHGVLNKVYGSNGRTIFIKDLISIYQATRCKSLAGKPKLFFIQACRGRDKMEGCEMETDGPMILEDTGLAVGQPLQGASIPNESDFLLGYSTVPGYFSYRNPEHGTRFINILCQMLNRYADSEDLMSILVKVNEEVSKTKAKVKGEIFKQTPAPMVTLRKKLFFS